MAPALHALQAPSTASPPRPGPGPRLMLGLLLGIAGLHGVTLSQLPTHVAEANPARPWVTRSLSPQPTAAGVTAPNAPTAAPAAHPTATAGAPPGVASANRHTKPPAPPSATPDTAAHDPDSRSQDSEAKAPSPNSAPTAAAVDVALASATPQQLHAPPSQAAASPSDAATPTAFASPPGGASAPPGSTVMAAANAHAGAKTTPPAGGDARIRVPPPRGLDYDIQGEAKGLGYSASGSLRWRHDGAAYDARLEIKAFLIGSRIQTSVGQITPAGLSPTRFGDKARSEQAAHFVRADGKVVFSANTPPAELGAGAQDRLSVLVQLGALVGAEPERYPAGTRLSLQTVSARESEIWDFVVGERKALALPGGTLDAIRLTRQPRRPFDQTIDVWLAPALDYLPARVRITQPNGDWAEQSWRQTLAP